MKYKKCPRCQLNYIREDESLCNPCKNQLDPNAEENNFIKNIKRNEVIKTGDIFPLSKQHQLINYLTGKNLKKLRKATYPLTNSCYIWFVALDGKERDGWKDIMLQDGRIKEKYVGVPSTIPSNLGLTFEYEYRAVFEKTGDSFIFRGIYKIDLKNTTIYERYYIKVSETTTLHDF